MANNAFTDQEVHSTLRLARSLSERIRSERNLRTYTDETATFLDYALATLGQIDRYVRDQSAPTSATALTAELRRKAFARNLIAIRRYIIALHSYVKMALDADTLNIPEPFAKVLNAVARTIDKDARIVVLATDEFNFFQHSTSNLADLDATGVFAPFPRTLGVVSFPYSERRAALGNTLLFHEVGHYFYQYHSIADKLAAVRYGGFKKAFEAAFAAAPATILKDSASQTYYEDELWTTLALWAQELYCDLFASATIGPSHLYSYWLLLAALPDAVAGGASFNETHPAHNYRMREAIALLRRSGNYDIVEQQTPEVAAWLAPLETLSPPPTWDCPEWTEVPDFQRLLLDTFDSHIKPVIVSSVAALPATSLFNRADFDAHHARVVATLSELVVPSDADRRRTGKAFRNSGRLRASSVLLSAFVFQLSGFPGWRDRLAPGVPVSQYLDHLNELVLKAIDDLLLVGKVVQQ